MNGQSGLDIAPLGSPILTAEAPGTDEEKDLSGNVFKPWVLSNLKGIEVKFAPHISGQFSQGTVRRLCYLFEHRLHTRHSMRGAFQSAGLQAEESK
jgi:hypothetical protein